MIPFRRRARPRPPGRGRDTEVGKQLLSLLSSLSAAEMQGVTEYVKSTIEKSKSTNVSEETRVKPKKQAGNSQLVEEERWKTVKRAKSTVGTEQDRKDKLEADGWSVPVKANVSEMSSNSPGVCLASCSEARRALEELRGAVAPMAVLAPANIEGKGVETSVFVTDKNGRTQTRVRFLFSKLALLQ